MSTTIYIYIMCYSDENDHQPTPLHDKPAFSILSRSFFAFFARFDVFIHGLDGVAYLREIKLFAFHPFATDSSSSSMDSGEIKETRDFNASAVASSILEYSKVCESRSSRARIFAAWLRREASRIMAMVFAAAVDDEPVEWRLAAALAREPLLPLVLVLLLVAVSFDVGVSILVNTSASFLSDNVSTAMEACKAEDAERSSAMSASGNHDRNGRSGCLCNR